MHQFLTRPLPKELDGLAELSLDMRWTWSHGSDELWRWLDPEFWERSHNPRLLLQLIPQRRLDEAARSPEFRATLKHWLQKRQKDLAEPGWMAAAHPNSPLKKVAYFSLEFGLGEALPIYSGGLGILAGDHLKTTSDLGVPMVGIGLLYQQGYFRQALDRDLKQLEAYTYNDPGSMPISPVTNGDGSWLRVGLDLPGRKLMLRVWLAQVGRNALYLLDSNDPMNSPYDRSITSSLYGGGPERRLLQEIVLGLGGWRTLEKLGIDVNVCHLNEGHAALAALARAESFMKQNNCSFLVAVRACRAGNVFTTHTSVDVAFDTFDQAHVVALLQPWISQLQVPEAYLLGLGRKNPDETREPFSMAWLAIRCSGFVNGVSRMHGRMSRRLFQGLYRDWPEAEVPVTHVTNGAHMPSWDSAAADALWTRHCGQQRWVAGPDHLCDGIKTATDAELWEFRGASRLALVETVRDRLVRQAQSHSASADAIDRARNVLDGKTLTIGFARRFTAYKRPTLILSSFHRLQRLLCNPERPVQLIVAGKAHPLDHEGKALVQAMAKFAARGEVADRVVFLEDYDMDLAEDLVGGVDVWLNTPRRPWEASGTSGMKALVNGGLNLSTLDGWWDEAYTPEVGWAIGDDRDAADPDRDNRDATHLYDLLEREVIPEFYTRDEKGIPQAWTKRIRASLSQLTPRFSSNRMTREYVESAYLPAATRYHARAADRAKLATELEAWSQSLAAHWRSLRFGEVSISRLANGWRYEVVVDLADINANAVQIELYAEPETLGELPLRVALKRTAAAGTGGSQLYMGEVVTSRPANHFTPRIVPCHPEALIPLEEGHIHWHRP